jgi:hypothetical protein
MTGNLPNRIGFRVSRQNRHSVKGFTHMANWVYRYVSAAAGDGRTQRANIGGPDRLGWLLRTRLPW